MFTDQLAVLFLLHIDPSPDKDSRVFHQQAAIFFIVPGEYHDFHIPYQILQVQESHHLIVLGIFDIPVRNHPAYRHAPLVLHPGSADLLVQGKIIGGIGNILLPQLLIRFQRMTA